MMTTYKGAGVDIEAADDLVENIKTLAKKTYGPEVLSGIGGFAGMFSLPLQGISRPVLVACTDGVGTKLKLAIEAFELTGLGQDLVAMCVNDLICSGARPLFFLDYFATGRLEQNIAHALLKSISQALQGISCALLGGETAEMPDLYHNKDFDLAGFSVGIVDQEKIIDGSQVKIGDQIIGMASSGPHSNGFSLIRKIIAQNHLDLKEKHTFAPKGLGKALLEPTVLYVNPILALLKKYPVHALAHITGGGLIGNLPRVFPEHLCAVLDKDALTPPEIFAFLQSQGEVPENEMWQVFNMGTGFCVITPENTAKDVISHLNKQGSPAKMIGRIEKKISNDSVLFT